jgi:hypothetical protein
MEKERLRAVGYRRVSMREQVDGHSLDAQEKNIRDYVEHNDWELIEIYTDAGISAKKNSRRPDLARLMQDARVGGFDVIVVDKVDRFYRHLAGLLTALDELRGLNVSFASVQERLDFTSPWGKLNAPFWVSLPKSIWITFVRKPSRANVSAPEKDYGTDLPPLGIVVGFALNARNLTGKITARNLVLRIKQMVSASSYTLSIPRS